MIARFDIMTPMKTLAIIGGGASGLAAAVAAGEKLARMGREQRFEKVRVVVYEADDRVGRTILATGNGRCNFSNEDVRASLYHNADFVGSVLLDFEIRACSEVTSQRKRSTSYGSGVLGFFSDCGLCWRGESEGRLYPLANKATSVLEVLRAAAAAAGVEERCDARVDALEPPRKPGSRYTLRLHDGSFERADAVILATGGKSAIRLPAQLPWIEPRPVLGPLATDTRLVRQLDNIRVKAALELRRAGKRIAREEGEVLFRKYGVSGIAVFNLSRFAQPGDALTVDFIPWIRAVDMESFLNRRRKLLRPHANDPLTCGDMLRGMVLPQVAHVLLESAGLSERTRYERGHVAVLVDLLKGFELHVEGIGDARQCQVHRGGVGVSALDSRTMEARELPGLYVTGELADVDAPCGGYNLHWAWASGLLAGWSAAELLTGVVGFTDDCGSDAHREIQNGGAR